MTKSGQQIFLALPPEGVRIIQHGKCFLISSTPPDTPPTPANDDHLDTPLSALLKIQRWKRGVVVKQRGHIPFVERQKLHALWKRLLQLEQKMIANIFR